MSVPTILALLTLVVAMPLNWLVTIKLWRMSRAAPGIRVLRERALVALALSIIVTVFALIFLNNDLAFPVLSGDATKLITRAVVLAASVIPSLYWLFLYR